MAMRWLILLLCVALAPSLVAYAQRDSKSSGKGATRGRPAKASASKSAQRAGNDQYSLEITPSKRIDAVLSYRIDSPNLRAKEWILFAANPPRNPGQSLTAQLVPNGQAGQELSPLHQGILTAQVPVASPQSPYLKGISAEVRIQGELYARHLHSDGSRPRRNIPEAVIERSRDFLGASGQMDFETASFQAWLDQHDLRRGAKEGEIDFARRVFLVIKRNFQYEYLARMNRAASHICSVGKSDCGGLAGVFVSALRAQGIPARVIVGRWAMSAQPKERVGEVAYYQQHAKAEFFAQGVGWVPADLSSAVLHDKSAEGLRFFGNDPGNFVTMHFDGGLEVDTVYFGQKKIPFLQGISYWVTGSGSLDGTTTSEDWQVR